MGGYLSPAKTEKKPPPVPPSVRIKILDIEGIRNNSSESDIECVMFLITVWSENPSLDITKLRVHWVGPTKSAYLTLAPASWTTATATNFAAEEIPVKSQRTSDWNPPNTFLLLWENMIYIKINLTSPDGINDTLGTGKIVKVYFEDLPGHVLEQQFTTPRSFGTNQYIDLTMG